MEKERSIDIKVFGQTFTVKTDAGEEHIREVEQCVNTKLDEILKKTRSVSTLNVAILVALNIADELIREREKRMAILREIEAKSKDLMEKIDIKLRGKELGKISITG